MTTMNQMMAAISDRRHGPLTRLAAGSAIVLLLAVAAPAPGRAQASQGAAPSQEIQQEVNPRAFVPSTVSEVWRQVYAALPDPTKAPAVPGPTDMEGWNKVHAAA